jgi:hypothetical protein
MLGVSPFKRSIMIVVSCRIAEGDTRRKTRRRLKVARIKIASSYPSRHGPLTYRHVDAIKPLRYAKIQIEVPRFPRVNSSQL